MLTYISLDRFTSSDDSKRQTQTWVTPFFHMRTETGSVSDTNVFYSQHQKRVKFQQSSNTSTEKNPGACRAPNYGHQVRSQSLYWQRISQVGKFIQKEICLYIALICVMTPSISLHCSGTCYRLVLSRISSEFLNSLALEMDI